MFNLFPDNNKNTQNDTHKHETDYKNELEKTYHFVDKLGVDIIVSEFASKLNNKTQKQTIYRKPTKKAVSWEHTAKEFFDRYFSNDK